MQRLDLTRVLRGLLLALLASVVLAACGGGKANRPDTLKATDIPPAFDMTLVADKDGQYELEGATLSEQEVKDNLRYRKDTNTLPKTILLKRGEKQKASDRHIAGVARIGLELHVRTFLQEKDGEEIQEIKTTSAPAQ